MFKTALSVLALSVSFASAAEVTVLRTDGLVAVPGEGAATEATILIEGSTILAVRQGSVSDETIEGEGHEIIESYDLTGHTVLPGFIDGHVHITSENNPQGRLQNVQLSAADRTMLGALHAKRTLDAGFTTVRDVGGNAQAVKALRDGIEMGAVSGPRIVMTGGVGITGGHGDGSLGYIDEIARFQNDERICNGADDCIRATRWVIARGADSIKIAATGGVLSNTATGVEQQMMDDELAAIVGAAGNYGRDVAAHAHGKQGIEAALRAGVRSIEHGTYADAESFRLFKRNDAFLVPTVLAGETVTEWAADPNTFLTPPQKAKAATVGPQIKDMLGRAHKAGVKIAFGTDSGVSRHGENAREFGLMVEAGMTPEEAIRAATVIGSQNVSMEDKIGTIEEGKLADIIAIDGDPFEDVTVLEDSVVFVMKDGEVAKAPGR
ncbi:metal-dependent hydrolase family protein [Parvularcula maris]|uniref:Amidohydrolase family protein n=1 Tax=Parvularcula maris TaxID=2965077 RepID=A0A9X2L8X0_9PROT|nr:amidohydrolase family protein [Parvularcula maris]MCQ8184372.1 amidohydrolase family protein [Parvularcula maris]